MNESDSIVRTQVDALKELLQQSRNAQCREAHDQAELQAVELRRKARKLARERVMRAAREERARLEREVRMVEAEIETEHRRRARMRDMALIQAGREALVPALAARWRDEASRAQWAECALAEAATVLLGTRWTLEHPRDWAAGEREAALEQARTRYGAEIEAHGVDDIEIGLRIKSAGALVDMSIPGLMSNERTIEGELLAEFNRAAKGETP